MNLKARVRVCAHFSTQRKVSSVSYAKQALRRLARRYQTLDTEISELDIEIRCLCTKANPALLATHGVGPDTSAALLVAAGDNPERMKSERSFAALCALSPVQASSGRTLRHRLSRGGNRQANSAPCGGCATNRMRTDAATKEYVARRQAEGKKRTEIIRCLKRHIAPQIYQLIINPPPTPELREATQPATATRNHRHPGRPNSRNQPQPHLGTQARPGPQPPTRHPIPDVAPNPRGGPVADLTNIGASWDGGEILGMGVRPRWNR